MVTKRFSPNENDKGFFAGVVMALAVLEIHGDDSQGATIARNAGHDFLKKMAEWSGNEQDKRVVERFCT